MDPAAFLDIAQQFQASNSEAERRTSIGRSYYTLFNILRQSLFSRGVRFSSSGADHRQLVDYLTQCRNQEAARIGGILKDLRVQRNQADYDMNITIDTNQSQLAYRRAQDAVDRFNALSQTDLQTIITHIQALPPLRQQRPRRQRRNL
jgi:uncharacterized protein (UPF0332 family)